MPNEWDDLKYVLALARHGSMSATARSLNTNNATVSRRIHAMGERLGQPVFNKVRSGWEITPFGARLLDVAMRLDDALHDIEKGVITPEEKTDIMVTSLDFVNRSILFPNLPKFRAANPMLQLNLHNSNENLSLAYGEADVAIRLGPSTSNRIISEKLCDVPCSIFAPHGARVTEWIALEEELDWVPEAQMARAYFGSAPTLRVTDYKAAQAASKEMGIACFLPDILATAAGGLQRVAGSPSVCREAWLLFHSSRKNDASVRSVGQWIKDSFAAVGMAEDAMSQARAAAA